jgi:hypothetical protein
MTTRILTISALLALCAGVAQSQSVVFTALDADASGGHSLAEVQAAFPNATEDDFNASDSDASGELSTESSPHGWRRIPAPRNINRQPGGFSPPGLLLAFQFSEVGDFCCRGAKAREQREAVHT